MEVIGVALRKLFPNHYVTLRNLCKKGGNVKELQQTIARLCQVPSKKRGNNFWLVDGCLNKAWFKSEDTKEHTQLESALSRQETALNAVRDARRIDPRNLHTCEVDLKSSKEDVKAARNAIAEWRHVVLVSEKTSKMYEYQGGKPLKYNVVGTCKSRDPTLVLEDGSLRPTDGIVDRYLSTIFKIYLIEISPRPTDPESKKTKTATVKTTKPTHIVGNYKAGCVVKPFPNTDCPMLKVIEAPACGFCQKEVGKATLMPCGCTITCLNCAYKVLHNSRVCPVCTNPVSIWQPKEDPAE